MAALSGRFFHLAHCRPADAGAYARCQHAVFHVLEADSAGMARVVDFAIFALVLFSAVNLAVGNIGLEFFFISVFAAEYIIRLWCIVWHRNYRRGGWRGRVKYATTNVAAIIDFIAIWPTLAVMLILGEVEVLPIFRLVSRLIMTGRRFSAMRLMGRVMLRSAGQLVSVLVTLAVFWLAASYLMNYAETNLPGGNHEQFGTIGDALWSSVVVLTTLPALEVTPGTLVGRVIAGFIALLGIGLFALPAGILTSNFMEAYQHEREGRFADKVICRASAETGAGPEQNRRRTMWPGAHRR